MSPTATICDYNGCVTYSTDALPGVVWAIIIIQLVLLLLLMPTYIVWVVRREQLRPQFLKVMDCCGITVVVLLTLFLGLIGFFISVCITESRFNAATNCLVMSPSAVAKPSPPDAACADFPAELARV